jgi:hypothetical protein
MTASRTAHSSSRMFVDVLVMADLISLGLDVMGVRSQEGDV